MLIHAPEPVGHGVTRRLSFLPLIVSAALGVMGLLLLATSPRGSIPIGSRPEETIPYFAVMLLLGLVGGLVASRRPENVIGWALGAMALDASLEFLTIGYAVHGLFGPTALPASSLAAWAYGPLGILFGLFAGLIVFTFPDGRIVSRRSAAGLLLLTAGCLLAVADLGLRPGPFAYLPSVSNPAGQTGLSSALELARVGAIALFLAGLALGVLTIRERFALASGDVRQQLKWFLGSLVLNGIVMAPALPFALGGDSTANYVARVIIVLALGTLPVVIGIAMLRYRLYDIDVLVNRALVYGAVSAALVGTYFAVVILIQALLRPFTSGSELAVAASTLIVVALFQPLRRRVQETVDRRFYRSRYDSARTVDAFSARLRDQVELDAVRADLVGVVHETVRPAHAGVWLRQIHR
jgi:hypothetical protein